MRHTAELMNRPPADQQHGKSLCTCSRRSASLSQGRPRGGCGPAPQSHPAFLPAASLRSHPEIILRLTGDIHAGEILSPSGVLTTKPHDSAGAHRRRAPESLILSLSWDYCESLLRKGSRQSCRRYCGTYNRSGIAAFILRDIGRWLVIFIRDRRP